MSGIWKPFNKDAPVEPRSLTMEDIEKFPEMIEELEHNLATNPALQIPMDPDKVITWNDIYGQPAATKS